ncbi:unnamed protein product [Psylliodes chrysocephalus]|uniref:Uncharacterized protein n=1 Tax=Psylliodes chrysocephalus TaxID=3402493 RepID=A0A9P0CXL1_9CUCU|nr:unnamed protein product [Psylliodes chrysocephala]
MAIIGSNAEDVASSYYAIIKRAPAHIKHYTFWCDNCSALNKNWKLYVALCTAAVNADWGPETVTVKYFEAGHSFMKADVVHGQIGKAMKKKSNVYDIHDLNDIIPKTSRHNKTLLLNFEDFYEFKEGNRQRRSKNSSENLPMLNNVKV